MPSEKHIDILDSDIPTTDWRVLSTALRDALFHLRPNAIVNINGIRLMYFEKCVNPVFVNGVKQQEINDVLLLLTDIDSSFDDYALRINNNCSALFEKITPGELRNQYRVVKPLTINSIAILSCSSLFSSEPANLCSLQEAYQRLQPLRVVQKTEFMADYYISWLHATIVHYDDKEFLSKLMSIGDLVYAPPMAYCFDNLELIGDIPPRYDGSCAFTVLLYLKFRTIKNNISRDDWLLLYDEVVETEMR